MNNKKTKKKHRTGIPERLGVAGKTVRTHSRIPHLEILKAAQSRADLVEIYHRHVLTQKTRTIRLLGKKSSARIIHTLLGYEVQASYKRIQCPDLVTAQYLRIFSELGCHSIRLPYDPTMTARLVPELEAALNSIARIVNQLFPGNPRLQQYVVQRVYGLIRRQLGSPPARDISITESESDDEKTTYKSH
jgi:hypothetical protein